MIRLRPHHMLCTQAYEGKGYSKEFIKNMNEKIALLRGEKECKIEICKGLDELCRYCPNNNGTSCETEEKVCLMDEKVCNYFNINEGNYIYKDLVRKIKNTITKEIMEEICENCTWYKSSNCSKFIISKF